MTPTKAAFLTIYGSMASVQSGEDAGSALVVMASFELIEHRRGCWQPVSDVAQSAWTAIGGEGNVTLEKLRDMGE